MTFDPKFRMDCAVMFTNEKNRMPRDVHELREWLREYAQGQTRLAEETWRLLEKYMAFKLPEPIIISRAESHNLAERAVLTNELELKNITDSVATDVPMSPELYKRVMGQK